MISIIETSHLNLVSRLADYKLELNYSNRCVGIFDMNKLLTCDAFSPLKDIALFNKVKKNRAAILWNEEIDLCADSLYLKK